ncbi:conjugative transposon protein TraN [Pedobacter sp. KR3-3]|uniref:Conjugative transposon protein TraN n=1 Tax=Pedobacter albus TaxID=3113905 RepID=A0ABU7IA83_9SPHI|nr:conjugative transposon protein TraN [Pedobacter sp. KR3-3]MEE1946398.1 conjugative transposon protein TraN [Pedobacter sp. KR3-3]
MKRLFIALIALMAGVSANGQTPPASIHPDAVLQPLGLEITWHKTTLILFPAPIQSADRGDSYVLAEKVKGAENALKVKAGQKDFEQSNLQVITTDGKVYSFTVNYAAQPLATTIDLRKQPPFAPVTFKDVSLNSGQVAQYATIVSAKPFLKKGRYHKNGIELKLTGVYVKGDVLFLSYNLKNATPLSFEPASLRFFVRDKKKAKRTAIQDKEVQPLAMHYYGAPEQATGQTVVAVFPKFTIAEKKYFTLELMEQNGDRNPATRLDQRLLLRARTLQ